MRFVSDEKGISCTRGYSESSDSFCNPALAAATTKAPSVGSPLMFHSAPASFSASRSPGATSRVSDASVAAISSFCNPVVGAIDPPPLKEKLPTSVEVAFVDQGYTGDDLKQDAKEAGIELIVVKLPEAKKGFVLLPRRWVVECSFAWTARFRRLASDFERAPETFRSFHFLASAILMLQTFVRSIAPAL